MTSRTLRATLILVLPLFLFLAQCKPQDSTPAIPKATSTPSATSASSATQAGATPGCVGLGCEKKECIGLGCGDSTPKCIGMGCEKERASQPSPGKE
jgi:hypothetical protein